MLKTTVEFSVDAPVLGIGSETSPELDALIARLKEDKAVASVAVEWKALPRFPSEPLAGAARIRVGIYGKTHTALRRTYARLTREVMKPPFRLSGRSCVLTDMYE